METSPILYNERRIFRCMIDNPRLGYELDSKWFSCTPARVVYETILYLYEHKVEITPANVATKADDERLYNFIENDVMKIDYKPEEFAFYSDNLRMAFVKRDINEHVLDDLKILTSSKGDLKFDKLEELYQLLSVDIDLARGKNQTLPVFSQVANRYRGKLVQRKLGETYPFGSSLLDKALNSGAEPGRISTIFGASGMGKSTFAINLFSWEINRGIPTMYVTLEMDETATMDRLIALRTRTPLRVLKMKKTYNEEGDISVDADYVISICEKELERLKKKENRFIILDKPALTLSDLEKAISDAKQRMCVDYMVVIIDLWTMLAKIGQKPTELEESVNKTSEIAKRQGVHIINVVQANREVDKKSVSSISAIDSLRPKTINHIKNSGAIGERSRFVVSVFRAKHYAEEYFPDDPQLEYMDDIMTLTVCKESEGKVGQRIKYLYDSECFRLTPYIDREEYENMQGEVSGEEGEIAEDE